MTELGLAREETQIAYERIYPSGRKGDGDIRMMDAVLPAGVVYLDRTQAVNMLINSLHLTERVLQDNPPLDDLKGLWIFDSSLKALIGVAAGQKTMPFYFSEKVEY